MGHSGSSASTATATAAIGIAVAGSAAALWAAAAGIRWAAQAASSASRSAADDNEITSTEVCTMYRDLRLHLEDTHRNLWRYLHRKLGDGSSHSWEVAAVAGHDDNEDSNKVARNKQVQDAVRSELERVGKRKLLLLLQEYNIENEARLTSAIQDLIECNDRPVLRVVQELDQFWATCSSTQNFLNANTV
jgi:hypothetical protein